MGAIDVWAQITTDRMAQRPWMATLLRWTGRAAGDARLEADPFGRPARLNEAGWQVDYFYDDNRPDALPARLHISRPGEIELKLRIEEWRALP